MIIAIFVFQLPDLGLMPDPFDFDSHNPRRVMEITFEVARLGESGLDYANPEKK